jgi:hypothetical protein
MELKSVSQKANDSLSLADIGKGKKSNTLLDLGVTIKPTFADPIFSHLYATERLRTK